MQNIIQTKRADIKKYFDEAAIIEGSQVYQLADYGLHYYNAEQYKQNDPNRNWVVTKIQIGHIEKDGYTYEYITDNDNNCALWINKNCRDYLLLPEFEGGQSVYDYDLNTLHSFYNKHDAFIWLQLYASPNKNRLAAIGCYYACPNEIVVYDCTAITSLPYKYMYRRPINGVITNFRWVDNETLLLEINGIEDTIILSNW